MILLIDPVSNQSIQRPASYRSEDLLKKASRVEAGETVANKGQREADQVSISFNLQGDLSLLQQSVDEVQNQVRDQLEKYFGVGREKTEALGIEFLPPDDASASKLLEFFSPEKTAERIVGFAASFFNSYAANHADESEEDQLAGFTNLISTAIEEGFGKARDVLGDLSGEDEVAQNINRTFSLVTEKIEEFRLKNFNKLGLEPEPVEPPQEAVQETDEAVDPLA